MSKIQGYVNIPNSIMRDENLSIQARFMWGAIKSLPKNWKFSVAGLASAIKEGKTTVNTAIKVLEKAGYLERKIIRNVQGRIVKTEYILHETPIVAKPKEDIPKAENQETESPQTEKVAVYNKGLSIKEKDIKDVYNIYPSIDKAEIERDFKKQIDYEKIINTFKTENRPPADTRILDDIVDVVLEIFCGTAQKFLIGSNSNNDWKKRDIVVKQLDKLNYDTFYEVVQNIINYDKPIGNFFNFALTALYKASIGVYSRENARANAWYCEETEAV